MTLDKLKHFPKPLDGRYVGKGQWQLLAPFEYRNGPVVVEVLANFITDGASIPKIAWSVIGSPWSGEYVYATIPHDWHYHTQKVTREEADKQFIDAMEILGVPWLKRRTMYRMVRMFAWICWNKQRKKLSST